jgi:CDP-diacylglycerol--glycerol-3-phosphate 3-phosphatidyltransferase
VHLTAIISIYWMAIVSIISAGDYFVGFWNKIDHVSSRKRRRSSVLSRKKREVSSPTV